MPPHHYGANDPRTNQQNARLFFLLGKLDIDSEQRAELVHQFTNSRTSSSREMLAHECNSLIHHLEGQLGEGEQDARYKMRRKVFSVAHELGWEGADGKVDKLRLHNWLLKYGMHKKELLKLSAKELTDTITQLERVAERAERHG
jgi:hypothetical protein